MIVSLNTVFLKRKYLNILLHDVFLFNKLVTLIFYDLNLKFQRVNYMNFLNLSYQLFNLFFFNCFTELYIYSFNNFFFPSRSHFFYGHLKISISFKRFFNFIFIHKQLNVFYKWLYIPFFFNIFEFKTDFNFPILISKFLSILHGKKNLFNNIYNNSFFVLIFRFFLFKCFVKFIIKKYMFLFTKLKFFFKLYFLYSCIYNTTKINNNSFLFFLKKLRFFVVVFKRKYFFLKKQVFKTYLAVILSQKGRNMFISLNTVSTSGGFRCLYKLSCGMSKLGKRKKQKNSKHSIKIIANHLVNFIFSLLKKNSNFVNLMIVLKGKRRLWRFKWIIRTLKKLKRQINMRVLLDRTNKIYGLVRRSKLRRM